MHASPQNWIFLRVDENANIQFSNTFKGNFKHALQVITNQPVCYVAIPGTFPAAVAHHRGTDGCLGTSWKSVKPRSYPKSTIG